MIEPVDLVASCATQRKAEIDDDLVVADPVEDERRAWIEAVGQSHVPACATPALSGKPHAYGTLRRHPASSPESTQFSGRAVVFLASHRFPRAGAGGSAPQLDDV